MDSGRPSTERRHGIIKANWQHFLASVLFIILFPLLPVFLEALLGEELSDKTVLISAIMYCSSLAFVSKSVWVLVLGFVSSVFLSISFGITFYNGAQAPAYSPHLAWFCIVGFGLGHVFERYDMHVIKAQDFIDLWKASA